MQIKNRLSAFLALCVAVTVMLLSTEKMQAQTETNADIVRRLIEAEEFKAEEQEQLRALPVESVELLTNELADVAPGQDDTRPFYLLAAKVAQFERDLGTDRLDGAVNELLSHIQTKPDITDSEATLLRLKLQKLAGIRDQRVKDAVKHAHAALESDGSPPSQNRSANTTVDPSLTNRPPAVESGKPSPSPESSGLNPVPTSPGSGSGSSAPWLLVAGLIAAALGLLWWLRKGRK